MMTYVYWTLYIVAACYMTGHVYRYMTDDTDLFDHKEKVCLAGIIGSCVGIILPIIIVWKLLGRYIFNIGLNHSRRIQEYSNKSIKEKEKRIEEKRLRVKELETIERELDVELSFGDAIIRRERSRQERLDKR